MPDPIRLARAAHNVLTRSLGLRRDQNLLIFADLAALEVVETIVRAACDLGITATTLFVPRVLQSESGGGAGLPLPTEAAIREADAVLSFLSDLPEHISYRLKVLHASWHRRAKLVHAPGMSLEALAACDTDYDTIAERVRLLSGALILGDRLDLVTTDARGGEHRLSVQIGGWDYPPGVNDGVIPDGAWGNLPPGEVYFVPRDGSGEVVINGALPGKLLGPGEELLLTFHKGRLVDMQPEDGPAARHLRATQITLAERRGDANWMNLAEVAFGLNPAILELTGASLPDQKRAHTVHIALGNSASLGGDVASIIHCDLVIRKPTAYVNGRLILKRGDWRINEADWRPDHRTVAVPSGWWDGLAQVRRSGVRAQRDGGRLVCPWNAGGGRWDSIPVGNDQTARLAARLYDLLPEGGGAVDIEAVLVAAERAGIPDTVLPGLVWIMSLYDLVRW